MATNEQIYERLGSIDTKIDTLVERDTDKENRIRHLEKSHWHNLGVVTITTAVFHTITSWARGGHQ